MDQSASPRVDPRLEPVKRAKGKQARAELERLSKDPAQSASTRLRAHLSVSKVPPPELITEENIIAALNIDDRVGFLPKLTKNVKLLRAELPLRTVTAGLKDLGPRSAHRLAKSLVRIAKKWDRQVPPAELSEATVRYFLQVIEHLSKQRFEPVKSPTKHPFVALAKIATKWITVAGRLELVFSILKVLRSMESRMGITIDKIEAEDPQFTNSFQVLLAMAMDQIEAFARRGAVSEFVEFSELMSAFPAARRELESKTSEMYFQKARLPEPIQEALRVLRGDSEIAAGTLKIQLDEEDAAQTIQLASALVAAWAGKKDGVKAQEAYDELASVAASFFGLQLHGEAGDIEEYNPRLHEFTIEARPSARVRLLRPWVEFSRRDRSKVILKAPVEAVEAAI